MRHLALACLVAVSLAACDRVPIDSGQSELVLASPDLSVVFLQPELSVRFEPTGPSGAVSLRIRNKDIDFDSTAGAFVYVRTLVPGLNAFDYTITNSEGAVARDTFYAVHLPLEPSALASPTDGVARAGAAVSALSGGRVLVSGGAGVSGSALASASVQFEDGPFINTREITLLRRRADHTATAVADGSLLLGGASTATSEVSSELVREPEFVDAKGVARPVSVASDAFPERSGHVAKAVVVGGETYVTLFGGVTPITGGLDASGTVDVYRVVPDGASVRLERLTPAGGAGGFPTLSGAALAETGPTSAVVTGLAADGGLTLALEWRSAPSGALPFSIDVAETGALRTPRADAAVLDLGNGLTLVTGGRDANGFTLGTFEVYAPAARRAFRFPPEIALAVPRSGHVATIFGGNRIVVSGGRPSSGGPVVAREAFTF
ncbi:hypothetical protein [Rubrivirga sp. IMCC43871]|uniref:hypothetical protein n=1 Tax=Rubrivirga sp. IMCC43871 TaxID=3391575 RepID=UPI00398FD8D0